MELISIHTGAVPTLARDPVSGFVRAAVEKLTPHKAVNFHAEQGRYVDENESFSSGNLLLTFEPSISETALGTNQLLSWYLGDLAFELDPCRVFEELFLRRTDRDGQEEYDDAVGRGDSEQLRYFDFVELIDHQNYHIYDGVVVFKVCQDPVWAVACAGCADIGTAIIQRGQIQLDRVKKNETVILFNN